MNIHNSEILISTFFFILYSPNLIFKPFLKNKWYNLALCSLFFFLSVYLFDSFFIQRYKYQFLEYFTEKNCNDPRILGHGTTKDMCEASNYADPLPNKLRSNTSNIHLKNTIVFDAQDYSKKIKQRTETWTPAPTNYLKVFQDIIDNATMNDIIKAEKINKNIRDRSKNSKDFIIEMKSKLSNQTPTPYYQTPTPYYQTPTPSIINKQIQDAKDSLKNAADIKIQAAQKQAAAKAAADAQKQASADARKQAEDARKKAEYARKQAEDAKKQVEAAQKEAAQKKSLFYKN